MAEIHRGRFQPGDPLPGYRTLAGQLGVSRNTVMAAYRELQAEGWVASTPGAGSAVARRPPGHLPAPAGRAGEPGPAPEMGFDLSGDTRPPAPQARRNLLEVRSGAPDPLLLPGAALARAYRRALTLNRGNALTVEDPQGHPRLREALAHMLAGTRGIPAAPERLLVTRGTRMSISLLADAMCAAGDTVAVEALGGRSAWEAIARAGARCHPIPVDGEGLDVDALARLLQAATVRAVLVTPQRQYPTLAPLSPGRRSRLLELARRHRFAVVEVDQDSEFQFEGRPLAPLAAADEGGVVVHVGTLSKIFAPGLRLGFVHGPAPLVGRLRELRAAFDRHGDPVLERAMAELMEDGELQRHLNRMHQVYRVRRDTLCAALGRELSGAAEAAPPSGGLALWLRIRDDLDVDAWAVRALERGVAFQPGRQFAFEGGQVQGLRIGFSNYPEPELEEVARRMRVALEGRS
ncbi:MAG: PLP-dependent aminotransferase family protein [Deltaproteobacteria bacterium]|nr:PLP-dependent aminotransferase family protein [Deltaproteobacteria bacterium]